MTDDPEITAKRSTYRFLLLVSNVGSFAIGTVFGVLVGLLLVVAAGQVSR